MAQYGPMHAAGTAEPPGAPPCLEHLISLIKDKDTDAAHVQHALLHPVAQLAVGADDHLRAGMSGGGGDGDSAKACC